MDGADAALGGAPQLALPVLPVLPGSAAVPPSASVSSRPDSASTNETAALVGSRPVSARLAGARPRSARPLAPMAPMSAAEAEDVQAQVREKMAARDARKREESHRSAADINARIQADAARRKEAEEARRAAADAERRAEADAINARLSARGVAKQGDAAA